MTDGDLKATPGLSASLSDLGVDSFAVVCAVSELEERFGIIVPLEGSLAGVEIVADIVTAVEELIAGREWR